MTFPNEKNFRLVVATQNEAGEWDFVKTPGPAVTEVPGAISGAAYWAVDDAHTPENVGGVPAAAGAAGLGGSRFLVVTFPAHSAGKLDIAASTGGSDMEAGFEGNKSMHASKTIDYEIILSGKVDFELPGGKKETLVPGDLLVVTGAPHAWANHYDEDCTYIAITIGFDK